jgi:hypothetical protein
MTLHRINLTEQAKAKRKKCLRKSFLEFKVKNLDFVILKSQETSVT